MESPKKLFLKNTNTLLHNIINIHHSSMMAKEKNIARNFFENFLQEKTIASTTATTPLTTLVNNPLHPNLCYTDPHATRPDEPYKRLLQPVIHHHYSHAYIINTVKKIGNTSSKVSLTEASRNIMEVSRNII